MLTRPAVRWRATIDSATPCAAARPARARFSKTKTSRESTENRAIVGSSEALIPGILAGEQGRWLPPSSEFRQGLSHQFRMTLPNFPPQYHFSRAADGSGTRRSGRDEVLSRAGMDRP